MVSLYRSAITAWKSTRSTGLNRLKNQSGTRTSHLRVSRIASCTWRAVPSRTASAPGWPSVARTCCHTMPITRSRSAATPRWPRAEFHASSSAPSDGTYQRSAICTTARPPKTPMTSPAVHQIPIAVSSSRAYRWRTRAPQARFCNWQATTSYGPANGGIS